MRRIMILISSSLVATVTVFFSCKNSELSTNNNSGVPQTDAKSDAILWDIDAMRCHIDPADYDQSCKVDSDCVRIVKGVGPYTALPVQAGNYCTPLCVCGGGVISEAAVTRYRHDISQTPLGSGAFFASTPCFCQSVPIEGTCQKGRCEAVLPLVSVDAGESDSDAGDWVTRDSSLPD